MNIKQAGKRLMIGGPVALLILIGAEFLSVTESEKRFLQVIASLVFLASMGLAFEVPLTQQFPQRWADRRWWNRAVSVAAVLAVYLALMTGEIDRRLRVWTTHYPSTGSGLAYALLGLCFLLVMPSRQRWVAVPLFGGALLFVFWPSGGGAFSYVVLGSLFGGMWYLAHRIAHRN